MSKRSSITGEEAFALGGQGGGGGGVTPAQLQEETNARIEADLENEEAIGVQKSRIDNLAQLTEGSTTGDAELMDIRVGADGTTYGNAGDAVRGQVSSVNTRVTDLEGDMEGYNCGTKDHFWSALESVEPSDYKTPCTLSFIQNGELQKYRYTESTIDNFDNPYYWKYDENNTIKEVYGNRGTRYQDSTDSYYYTPFVFDDYLTPETDVKFRNNIARIRGIRCYDMNDVTCQIATAYVAAGMNHYMSYRDGVKTVEVCQTNISPASSYLPPVYAYYEKKDSAKQLGYNLLDISKITKWNSTIRIVADDGEVGYKYNIVTNQTKDVVYGFCEVKENTTYCYKLQNKGVYNRVIDSIPCFDENHELISFVPFAVGVGSQNADQFYFKTPQGCRYVYLTVATSNNVGYWINGTLNLKPILCEYRYIQDAIDDLDKETVLNKSEITSWFRQDYSDKTVWVFGDSWTQRNGKPNNQARPTSSTGGLDWTTILYQKCQFKRYTVFANGGATISDTAENPEETTNNTMIAQVNTALMGLANNTYDYPDIVLVMGYVNDIDASPTRYVTDADLDGADYDEYMTRTFFAKNDLGTYGNTYLVDLDDVPCGKIAGAMRYIVEKIGNVAVADTENLKMPYFVFFDSAQMANVTPYAQGKARRDYKWMAEKLNVPFLTINSVNAPMLWDLRTNNDGTLTQHHYWLKDGTHPFDNDSVSLGQERYAQAVYDEFVKLFGTM